MESLNYNGFKLAYWRYGMSDAPAIVLIMGLGMSHVAWPISMIQHLVEEGFQVIALDNRDCGESSRCEFVVPSREIPLAIMKAICRKKVVSTYALEDMALDVEHLLNHLSIRRAHVVGISMGGMIAQVLSVQCPNRVASLISIASASGNPRTGLGHFSAIWALIRKPKSMSDKQSLRDYFTRMFVVLSGKKYRPQGEELEEMLRQALGMGYDVEATYRQLLALLASGDRSWQLTRIQTPTLVIHGTEDPLLPMEAGQETANLIPNAQFVAIEGMGHQLPQALIGQIATLITNHCHRYPA